jgi:hypothetical protein
MKTALELLVYTVRDLEASILKECTSSCLIHYDGVLPGCHIPLYGRGSLNIYLQRFVQKKLPHTVIIPDKTEAKTDTDHLAVGNVIVIAQLVLNWFSWEPPSASSI